jgi:hypothetical protein
MFQSHKGRDFPDQMSSSQFLRKDCVPWSLSYVSVTQAFRLRKEGGLLKNIFEGRMKLRKLPKKMHNFSRHFILLVFLCQYQTYV